MDVVQVAWRAAGSPPHDPLTAEPDECARCGSLEHLTRSRVVSDSFTAFSGWRRPAHSGVCSACAWTYTTARLRAVPFLVDREAVTLQELNGPALARVLTAGHLPVDQAVTVPTRAGRQHVLPRARWGMVTVDELSLSWRAQDAQRMLAALQLVQSYGARPTTLSSSSPPYRWLATHPPGDWQRLQQLWAALGPWRTDPSPWLATVQVIERLTQRARSG